VTVNSGDVEAWLDDQIKHHAKWRSTWSFLYFFFAATTIVAGAATTAVAGLLDGPGATLWTTLLAALTTIMASLEKVLKFREKWDLHRNIQVAFEMINMRAKNGMIALDKVVDGIDAVAQMYSSQLSELTSSKPPGVGGNDTGDGATS